VSTNPFYYGGPVEPSRLLGRERELRRVFDRLSMGQSVAVTGHPHTGKSSLLGSILDPGSRKSRRSRQFDSTLFCSLDAQLLGTAESPADFWRRALLPLENQKSLNELYRQAVDADFEVFVLRRLFTGMRLLEQRLVLVIDEFEALFAQASLNTSSFYGALRSLASTTQGLSLVISSRYDVAHLNRLTQELNPHGSPYFNTLTEVTLGALADDTIDALALLLGENMIPTDTQFIKAVSGCQPYIAQATGGILWDLRTDGLTGEESYVMAGKHLGRQLNYHFADCWRLWSNETKQVLTSIALAQIPSLLGDRRVHVKEILENIADYSAELADLDTCGVLKHRSNGDWVIKQESFLWWLADEIRRSLRSSTDFQSWLHAQEIDNLLTRKQRDRLEQTAKGTFAALGKGTTTLIEAFAKGMGGILTGSQ